MRSPSSSTSIGLAALALVGCAKHVVVTSSVEPTAPQRPRRGAQVDKLSTVGAPFAVTLERGLVPVKFGKAYVTADSLRVSLSDKEVSCGGAVVADDAYAVELDLFPGPALGFFAGHPIGIEVAVRRPGVSGGVVAPPYLVDARLEPFRLVAGEHLRGSLDFRFEWTDRTDTARHHAVGSGSFDAQICEIVGEKMIGVPADAGDAALAGTFAGAQFAYRSALARVRHEDRQGAAVDFIDVIEFYAGDVTCDNRSAYAKTRTYFSLSAISGANSRQRITGYPQPADARFVTPDPANGFANSQQFGRPGAWVRLDTLAFEQGSSINGVALADSAGPEPWLTGRIGGRFAATICREGAVSSGGAGAGRSR
jgi:hypothetical protein